MKAEWLERDTSVCRVSVKDRMGGEGVKNREKRKEGVWERAEWCWIQLPVSAVHKKKPCTLIKWKQILHLLNLHTAGLGLKFLLTAALTKNTVQAARVCVFFFFFLFKLWLWITHNNYYVNKPRYTGLDSPASLWVLVQMTQPVYTG